MSDEERRRIDAAFAAHKREQAERLLTLTPAQRLRWLETTVRELKTLMERARQAKLRAADASAPDSSDGD